MVTLGARVEQPEIDVDVKNGKMIVDVKAKVTAELSDSSSGVDYTRGENRQLLQKQISESVKASIAAYFAATQPLGADCVQVSNQYRRQVSTWHEWAGMDWPSLYKDAQIRLQVETSMHRSGLLWRYGGGENI